MLTTYHVENVGFVSVTTRNMYKAHVSNLKNKFAIRIRRPGFIVSNPFHYKSVAKTKIVV